VETEKIPAGLWLKAFVRQMEEERVADAVDTIYDYLLREYEDATDLSDMPSWFLLMVEELGDYHMVRLSERVQPE
jgi:hypothetical protein